MSLSTKFLCSMYLPLNSIRLIRHIICLIIAMSFIGDSFCLSITLNQHYTKTPVTIHVAIV